MNIKSRSWECCYKMFSFQTLFWWGFLHLIPVWADWSKYLPYQSITQSKQHKQQSLITNQDQRDVVIKMFLCEPCYSINMSSFCPVWHIPSTSFTSTMSADCVVCKTTVRERQESIECDNPSCKRWTHRTCGTGKHIQHS